MAPEESKHEARSDEDEGERLDRELIELLNELRGLTSAKGRSPTSWRWGRAR